MGLQVNTIKYSIKLSPYADDLTITIREESEIQVQCFGKASSTVVNRGKIDALWCGKGF